MTNNATAKKTLRKIFGDLRKQISTHDKEILSQAIAKNFFALLQQQQINYQNKIFASYIATPNEVDPRYIDAGLQQHNITICYPKINNLSLDFIAPNNSQFQFHHDFKSILEPIEGTILIPDFLIVPLIGFDKKLNRLGNGKGFYDRAIYNLKIQNPNLIAIGLAFTNQYYDGIFAYEKHDQSLDYVVTNQKIFYLESR